MESLFCCPICGGKLEREEGSYLCPKGHSFDVAREGYVNLLPANRKHAKSPGDDKEMVKARTRFLEGGWYGPLRAELGRLTEQYAPEGGSLLDAGCGEGYYTETLSQVMAAKGGSVAGVDLSKPSVKWAAKRCPEAEFAVSSVYHLPLKDRSVDVVADCFSPLAIEEFHRVLKPGGTFIYVVPGPRHLWEMKEILYEKPYENAEKQECYEGFEYLEICPVEHRFTLNLGEDIRALFQMTPYAWKSPKLGVQRLWGREQLNLTAQFRIHVFREVEKKSR